MNVLRLTDVEKEILYLVLMDAGAPVSKVARALKCREHTVTYAINKFREQGLISRRIMIDIFRLGLLRYALYISLSSSGQKQREAISEHLERSPYTSVVLEVGGEYDFFVALIVRNPGELAQFQRNLSTRFGAPFVRKDVAISVKHSVFGEKCLLKDSRLLSECSYSVSAARIEIDHLDHRLLCMLGNIDVTSLAMVARSLGLPKSTVEYRVSRLKERGIICGDMHEIRGELIGLNNFIVLVGMKGLSDKLHEAFHKFARAHRFIAHCSDEVGLWDYMLGVAATRQQDVNDLVELLHQHFGDYISSVRSFPMFRARKVRDYPFDPEGHAALWESAA